MGDKGKGKMLLEVETGKAVNMQLQQAALSGGKSGPEGGLPNEGQNPSVQKARKSRVKLGPVLEGLKSRLGEVQDNINCIASNTLYGTLIGEPVDVKEIRRIIRYHWKFIKDGFQFILMANNWFELRFDDQADKAKVWEGRPFHISHQLLLLKEWRIDFDPFTESLSQVDVWIRFPGLPIKFVSNQILVALVEENKLGYVLKIDAFNIYGARKHYPRVCVAMDLAKVVEKKIYVLNEKEEVLTFPIWFEDFSVGCGACGSTTHLFDECPSRWPFLKQAGAPAMEAGEGIGVF